MSLLSDLKYAWRFGDVFGVAAPLRDHVNGVDVTPGGSGAFPSGHQADSESAPLSGALIGRNYKTQPLAHIRGWGEATVSLSPPLTLAVWCRRLSDATDGVGWNVARLTHSTTPNDSPQPRLRIAPLASLRRIELSAVQADDSTLTVWENPAITGGTESPQLLVMRITGSGITLDVSGHRYTSSQSIKTGSLDTLILGPQAVASEDVPSQWYDTSPATLFIPECYIWARSLSDSEVDALFELDGSVPALAALYPFGLGSSATGDAILTIAANELLLSSAASGDAGLTVAANEPLVSSSASGDGVLTVAASEPDINAITVGDAVLTPAAEALAVNALADGDAALTVAANEPLLTWATTGEATLTVAASEPTVNAVAAGDATLTAAATTVVVGAVTIPRADTVLLTESCDSGTLADWTALLMTDAVTAITGQTGGGVSVSNTAAESGGYVAPVSAPQLGFSGQWKALGAMQGGYLVGLVDEQGTLVLRADYDHNTHLAHLTVFNGSAWSQADAVSLSDLSLTIDDGAWHAIALRWSGSAAQVSVSIDSTDVLSATLPQFAGESFAPALLTNPGFSLGYDAHGWDEITITASAAPELEVTSSEPTLDAPADASAAGDAVLTVAGSLPTLNAVAAGDATLTVAASEPSIVTPASAAGDAVLTVAATEPTVTAIASGDAVLTVAASALQVNAFAAGDATLTVAATEPTVVAIAVASAAGDARLVVTAAPPRLSTFPTGFVRKAPVVAGGGK